MAPLGGEAGGKIYRYVEVKPKDEEEIEAVTCRDPVAALRSLQLPSLLDASSAERVVVADSIVVRW